jgi:DNA-binding NarL/FixJ family response regulator
MAPRSRIFIVDDHPLVREWLSRLLAEQPDLEVCGQASDVAAALAAMAAAPPDVAIVDLALKGGSGLDLVKELRARHPEVATLVFSMYDEMDYAERALRAGARGYVNKGESTARLIEAVRQVRGGRVYASPELLARLASRAVGRGGAGAPSAVTRLSDREFEVFRRLGQAQTTRRIATELAVSIKTVQAFCARIKDKLGLAGGAELVREAVRWVENEGRGPAAPPPPERKKP